MRSLGFLPIPTAECYVDLLFGPAYREGGCWGWQYVSI